MDDGTPRRPGRHRREDPSPRFATPIFNQDTPPRRPWEIAAESPPPIQSAGCIPDIPSECEDIYFPTSVLGEVIVSIWKSPQKIARERKMRREVIVISDDDEPGCPPTRPSPRKKRRLAKKPTVPVVIEIDSSEDETPSLWPPAPPPLTDVEELQVVERPEMDIDASMLDPIVQESTATPPVPELNVPVAVRELQDSVIPPEKPDHSVKSPADHPWNPSTPPETVRARLPSYREFDEALATLGGGSEAVGVPTDHPWNRLTPPETDEVRLPLYREFDEALATLERDSEATSPPTDPHSDEASSAADPTGVASALIPSQIQSALVAPLSSTPPIFHRPLLTMRACLRGSRAVRGGRGGRRVLMTRKKPIFHPHTATKPFSKTMRQETSEGQAVQEPATDGFLLSTSIGRTFEQAARAQGPVVYEIFRRNCAEAEARRREQLPAKASLDGGVENFRVEGDADAAKGRVASFLNASELRPPSSRVPFPLPEDQPSPAPEAAEDPSTEALNARHDLQDLKLQLTDHPVLASVHNSPSSQSSEPPAAAPTPRSEFSDGYTPPAESPRSDSTLGSTPLEPVHLPAMLIPLVSVAPAVLKQVNAVEDEEDGFDDMDLAYPT